MGSLVPGWDSNCCVPEDVKDYEDPKLPSSPKSRLPAKHLHEPNLHRCSAPAVLGSPRQRPNSPSSPRSGRIYVIKHGHTDNEEEGADDRAMLDDPLHAKQHWVTRMDSASLNLAPDVEDPHIAHPGQHGIGPHPPLAFKPDHFAQETMHLREHMRRGGEGGTPQ